MRIIWRTLGVSLEVTIVDRAARLSAGLLGDQLNPRPRMIVLGLVVMTFWVSILVRTYAWIVILGNAGLVNRSGCGWG